jgi:hypothetical protein
MLIELQGSKYANKVRRLSSQLMLAKLADTSDQFRSAPEFFEHASWLFDIERPISDHTQVRRGTATRIQIS